MGRDRRKQSQAPESSSIQTRSRAASLAPTSTEPRRQVDLDLDLVQDNIRTDNETRTVFPEEKELPSNSSLDTVEDDAVAVGSVSSQDTSKSGSPSEGQTIIATEPVLASVTRSAPASPSERGTVLYLRGGKRNILVNVPWVLDYSVPSNLQEAKKYLNKQADILKNYLYLGAFFGPTSPSTSPPPPPPALRQ